MKMNEMKIGKNGVNKETLIEIEKNLKNTEALKIKFLKNILDSNDKEDIVTKIKQILPMNIAITKKIGNTLTLKKQ